MSFALILRPHDVLLFRDGKPFSAGTDTRARSLFPPTPFTVQGAIRARVLFSSGVSLAAYATSPSDSAVQALRQKIGFASQSYGQLRLQGPFLARQEEGIWVRYFPAPADIVQCNGQYHLLQPQRNLPFESNLPEGLVWSWIHTPDQVENPRGWISEAQLRLYLEGQPPMQLVQEDEFVLHEPRFGIALQAETKTVQEGFLYMADFLRLKEEVAFWVELDGIQPSDLGGEQGFLQLGGEARVVWYRREESRPLPRMALLPEQFKVVLLTPAWFAEGWRPKDWCTFFSGSVRLVAAVIPRYQSLGGAYVDDQHRRGAFQKPLRRFVPAGSVFYFEHDGEAIYNGQPFTETPAGEGDFGQIGFGCAVIGKWAYT